jgi:hypothetical protein
VRLYEMDTGEATKTSSAKNLRDLGLKNGYKMQTMPETVTTKDGTFEIHSESHGPHWVAWLARTSDGGPEQSVLLVGQTQAEAEARARMWAERR